MKKKTISSILTAVIIMLSITIVILIIKIEKRPDVVDEKDEKQIVNEIIANSSESDSTKKEEPVAPVETDEPEPVTTKWVRVTQNVNVRTGPGTENERIGSAYVGNEFELVEQLESGWSMVIYDGGNAYIHSDYLEVFDKIETGETNPKPQENTSADQKQPDTKPDTTQQPENEDADTTNGITLTQ